MQVVDVLVVGAGAAGLFCAAHAAKRNRKVLILEKSSKPGRKILMSGGGRCNFTNLYVSPDKYLSRNPHFCKSALSQYTQWDFIDWVESHGIAYHEKAQGQLFCDDKAAALLNPLLADLNAVGVSIQKNTEINNVSFLPDGAGFVCDTTQGVIQTSSLVVATGGLSIPSMGTTPFAYQLAETFEIPVIPTRAGLVPFTLDAKDKEQLSPLSGISFEADLHCHQATFTDDILLTHRGISGPAALQLSSYWKGGDPISINCFPKVSLDSLIESGKEHQPAQTLKTYLSQHLPNRLLVERTPENLHQKRLADLSAKDIALLNAIWCDWTLIPSGTEGYRTAEVTLGGVDTNALSSKTMAVKEIPHLFFIGEAVDVTGWLGGYNFQWAWSSAWVAAQAC